MPSLDLNYLTSELPLYMQEVLGKMGQDITSNLLAKGVEGLVKGAGGGIRSIGGSLWNRLRSSSDSKRALEAFAESWMHAVNAAEREAAIRTLLTDNPQFAASASALIQRRDYVVALRDYAAELPVAGFETSVSLSDVYVPLPLVADGSDGKRAEKTEATQLALEGNHLVISETGGGKSSLLRSLAFSDPDERLEAIDCLEQLGFRTLSRRLLTTLNLRELDPARAASQLIRSGRKADAVVLLSATPHERCDDEDYLRRVMSEVGLQYASA